MFNIKKLMPLVFVFVYASTVFAGDTGKVNYMSIASNIAVTVRPGTVQFSIEGGFQDARGDCNKDYAAISGEDQHLISLLLMAKAQDKEIEVHLDPANMYYADRCLVSYIEFR